MSCTLVSAPLRRFSRTLVSLAVALKSFSVLLFVPPAPKVLTEIKRTIYTAFSPLIVQLKFSQNAIENKGYNDLATALCYFSNKERKQIDRPEVIGVAKGGDPVTCPLPQLKCH